MWYFKTFCLPETGNRRQMNHSCYQPFWEISKSLLKSLSEYIYSKKLDHFFAIKFHLLTKYKDQSISCINDYYGYQKRFKTTVSLPLTIYKGLLFMMQFSQESGIQLVIDFSERSNCLIKALFHPLDCNLGRRGLDSSYFTALKRYVSRLNDTAWFTVLN